MNPEFCFHVVGRPASCNNRNHYYYTWITTVHAEAAAAYNIYAPPPNTPYNKKVYVSVIHFHTVGNFPDVDNILKPILDGIKGNVIKDDNNVEQVTSRRFRPEFHSRLTVPPTSAPAVVSAINEAISGNTTIAVKVSPPPSDYQVQW